MHYRSASLFTVSVNRDIVCSVSWITIADTLNVHLINCLYCKMVIIIGIALKYFLQYCTTFVAKYQHASDVLIHVVPS